MAFDSVNTAHCASFIGVKPPTEHDAHLTKSNFQTHPRGVGRWQKNPVASACSNVVAEDGAMLNALLLDIDAYEEKYGEKAVRKNLTGSLTLNGSGKTNLIFSPLNVVGPAQCHAVSGG